LQKEEVGFEHQAAIMPDVPPPEQARIFSFVPFGIYGRKNRLLISKQMQLLNLEEIRERRLTDPRIPAYFF
jgi:acyl-coenzyme A thioesterase 1/2/4